MCKTKFRRTKRRRTKCRRTKFNRIAKGINLDVTDNKGYSIREALAFYSAIITEYKFYNNRNIEKLINNINKIRQSSNTTFKVTAPLLHNIKMAKKQLKRLSYQDTPIINTSALKHLLELLDKLILLGVRPKIRRSTPNRGLRCVGEPEWMPVIRMM